MISMPWTDEQVAALNAYQAKAPFHPFTCGYRDDHYSVDPGILIATPTGWECPYKYCDYMQHWAHPFMADPHWVDCNGGLYHTLGRCHDDL